MDIIKLNFLLFVILAAEISHHAVLSQCDLPFVSVGDECYFFSSPAKTANFIEAQEICEQMESTLAIIDTEEKQNAIAPYIMEFSSEIYFYIGGYSLGQNDSYIWNGIGQPLTYTNFITVSKGEYCIMTSSGYSAQWVVFECQSENYFICQKLNNSCYDSAAETKCSGSYTLVNGKCYEFVTEKELKWIEAKEYCERRGSVLAILDSEEINSRITSIVSENFNTLTFWIGAYDQSHEGTWVWDGKGTNISYSNWYPGQPDGVTEENCAAIGSIDGTISWEDLNCNLANDFICQQLPESCGVVSIPDVCTGGEKPKCDPPFADYGGGCFLVLPGNSTVRLSWSESVAMCDHMGATIGYILNAEEQDALTNYMTAQTFTGLHCGYWIGLNDVNNDGIWTWEGTDQSVNYTDWVTGIPREGYFNYCAYANAYCNENGQWDNESVCSTDQLFICRK